MFEGIVDLFEETCLLALDFRLLLKETELSYIFKFWEFSISLPLFFGWRNAIFSFLYWGCSVILSLVHSLNIFLFKIFLTIHLQKDLNQPFFDWFLIRKHSLKFSCSNCEFRLCKFTIALETSFKFFIMLSFSSFFKSWLEYNSFIVFSEIFN